jgi:hypothetical protein
MIKAYEEYSSLPAWQKYRGFKGAHPRDVVQMANNTFLRNIFSYSNPKSLLFKHVNLPFKHTVSDYNLVYASGNPVRTGISRLKETKQNLGKNTTFEDGAPGAIPPGWMWLVRPNETVQASTSDEHVHGGSKSLRIDAAGNVAKGQAEHPIVRSEEINVEPGQHYRLTASIKSSNPSAKVRLVAQCHPPHWLRETTITATPEWKEYELIFCTPAPGDPEFNPAMKKMWIRFDLLESTGCIWVDDVAFAQAVMKDEWDAWREQGLDAHSLVADPLFVNPRENDYRLQENSPALRLGFKPIPFEKIGPYADPLRASWPIVEAAGARERSFTRDQKQPPGSHPSN